MNKFLTETGTLKKIDLDGTGSKSVLSSFSVDCYVEWSRKRTINTDGDEIVANATVFIKPHDSIDVSHKRWDFTFESETYKVEKINRIKKIGKNTVDHYEAMLR